VEWMNRIVWARSSLLFIAYHFQPQTSQINPNNQKNRKINNSLLIIQNRSLIHSFSTSNFLNASSKTPQKARNESYKNPQTTKMNFPKNQISFIFFISMLKLQ
jgi:hypothetical protein